MQPRRLFDTGSAAITGYKIEQSVDGGTTWTVAVADTGDTLVTKTLTGLTNGVEYQIRIQSKNAIGLSATSSVVARYDDVDPCLSHPVDISFEESELVGSY